VQDQIIKKDYKMMQESANSTGLPIQIYGPEIRIMAVVVLALGLVNQDDFSELDNKQHQQKVAATKKQSGSSSLDRPQVVLLLLLAVLYMDCNIVPCREC
jgi:hypothetical protein